MFPAARCRQLVSSYRTVALGTSRPFSGIVGLREIDVSFRPPELENSRACRHLRREFRVPGLIYGAGNGTFPLKQTRKAVSMSTFDVQRHWRQLGKSLENTLFTVRVDDGSSYVALPRQLQAHPVSENPLSLNFLVYRPGQEVRIPVKYINQEDCVDIRRGAFIVPVKHFVSVSIEQGAEIPSFFNIDVAQYGKNKVFTVKDLHFPDGVGLHRRFDPASALGVIKGSARA